MPVGDGDQVDVRVAVMQFRRQRLTQEVHCNIWVEFNSYEVKPLYQIPG